MPVVSQRTKKIACAMMLSSTMLIRDIFNSIKDEFERCCNGADDPKKRIVILDLRSPYLFHVNGYLKQVRRCVERVIKRSSGFEYRLHTDGKSRRFITVVLRHKAPAKARAKFKTPTKATFVDGPFRGREVVWSTRQQHDVDSMFKDHQNKTFEVKPDIWNNSLYGWSIGS